MTFDDARIMIVRGLAGVGIGSFLGYICGDQGPVALIAIRETISGPPESVPAVASPIWRYCGLLVGAGIGLLVCMRPMSHESKSKLGEMMLILGPIGGFLSMLAFLSVTNLFEPRIQLVRSIVVFVWLSGSVCVGYMTGRLVRNAMLAGITLSPNPTPRS